MSAPRVVAAAIAVALASPAAAQQPVPPVTPPPTALQLADVQQAAVAADPRTRELGLLDSQSALRLANIAALRLPTAAIDGQVQYQSDVPAAPLLTASGQPIFSAPKATYDSSVRVEQRLFAPVVGAQAALARAQLGEQQARVRTAVHGVRQQASDAFFAAASLQQELSVLAATIAELDGRLREMTARVQEGTALPADAAAVEATLLERRQDEDELRVNRHAALARLATMTGAPIADDATPVIPDLGAAVAEARERFATLRARPEYDQFERERERVARQRDLETAQARPTVTAFGRAGYGRPGLDFIDDAWEPYGVGGVRVQWNAWTWGSTGREREAQSLQQEILAADEAAFTKGLVESVEGDLATIDHLERALATDQRIVELRSEVERSARVRLEEGVVTASDYLARDTELLQARLAHASHEVELAQARARFLTTLGLEVR